MIYDKINYHKILFQNSSSLVGKINLNIQKASSEINNRSWIKKNEILDTEVEVNFDKLTDFGNEVHSNEIHWWVFKKETDIEDFGEKSQIALDNVVKLKRESESLKTSYFSESYSDTIQRINEFTEEYKGEIQQLFDYVIWLKEKDPLAPSILFTDKIWASTRLIYKDALIKIDTKEENEIINRCTEISLGLYHAKNGYTLFEVHHKINNEMSEIDPETHNPNNFSLNRIYAQSSFKILDRMATFFRLIRTSLDTIIDEINNYKELDELLCSTSEQRLQKGKPFAFISHDSRDKKEVASHIAVGLTDMECPIWYDEYSLKVGDNLRESIEKGLKECEKCIIILSPNFLSNEGWTKKEFESIYIREMMENKQIFLPVWFGVNEKELFKYCTSLSGIFAVNWNLGKDNVIKELYKALK